MYIYIMYKYVYITKGYYPDGGGAFKDCHTKFQLTVNWMLFSMKVISVFSPRSQRWVFIDVV